MKKEHFFFHRTWDMCNAISVHWFPPWPSTNRPHLFLLSLRHFTWTTSPPCSSFYTPGCCSFWYLLCPCFFGQVYRWFPVPLPLTRFFINSHFISESFPELITGNSSKCPPPQCSFTKVYFAPTSGDLFTLLKVHLPPRMKAENFSYILCYSLTLRIVSGTLYVLNKYILKN